MNLSSDSLTRQMLRNLFLMETGITCLLKRDLNSWSRNTKWNLLTLARLNFSNKLMLSDWNWRTPILDVQNLEGSKNRLREELAMEEKALGGTQIWRIHELREFKRAQELRVGEFSVHKLREGHAAIQKLTSQIQELQEMVNCMSDSGEFQDIESNFSGKNSHVPSQPAVVPSPRSMLSRDRRMPFDTWNLFETHNPRSTFNSSQTRYQGILHSTTPSARGAIPVQVSTGRPVARGAERLGSTTPMPMSATRPSTLNSS